MCLWGQLLSFAARTRTGWSWNESVVCTDTSRSLLQVYFWWELFITRHVGNLRSFAVKQQSYAPNLAVYLFIMLTLSANVWTSISHIDGQEKEGQLSGLHVLLTSCLRTSCFGDIWKMMCTAKECMNSKLGSWQQLSMLQRICYSECGSRQTVDGMYAELLMMFDVKCLKPNDFLLVCNRIIFQLTNNIVQTISSISLSYMCRNSSH
jgi:hypothetical protein